MYCYPEQLLTLVMGSLWNQGGALPDAFAYEALQNKDISKTIKANIPLRHKLIAQMKNTEVLWIYIFSHQELDLILNSIKYDYVWEIV